MSFKPIDGKRDEFRKYLERAGVLEAISKAFIKIFECTERPENALEFLRVNLGDNLQKEDTIEHLKRELEDKKNEILRLNRIIDAQKADSTSDIAADVVTPKIEPIEITDEQSESLNTNVVDQAADFENDNNDEATSSTKIDA